MSTLEERVREALRADAATVRPDSIPAGPPSRQARTARGLPGSCGPRSRRTRPLIPLAAAAAVTALLTGLSLAAPHLLSGGRPDSGSPGPAPTGLSGFPTGGADPVFNVGPPQPPVLAADASRGVPSSAPRPGLPRFYVTSYIEPVGILNYIAVRDTTTGRVVWRIYPPGRNFFGGLAGTAGDRTFITALDPPSGTAHSQLYQFQLNQSGVPGPLEPLHITLPGPVPQIMGGLAITPDGTTIAYAADSSFGVINLATRQVRFWSESAVRTSAVQMLSSETTGLSLSADGQLLAIPSFSGTRVLRTSAPAGPLSARSRLVSRTMIWAAFAPDDQSLYGCAVSPWVPGVRPNTGTLTYSRLWLTGSQDSVVASWAHVTVPQCYASIDPAGNALLVQFPTTVPDGDDWLRPAILDLATRRLTNINAPAFYGPFNIAW